MCSDLKQTTKKLWQLVNEIVNEKSNKMHMIDCLTIDNIKETDSKSIAKEFGKYFASVGRKYTSKIDDPKKSLDEYMKKINRNNSTIFLYPTNSVEIERLINNLPSKMSGGHDGISNVLLKKICEQVKTPLTIVFNTSIETGIVPDIMKIADVVPLHKSKSKETTDDYRPISLLLTISKILEKILYKRTYTFLENTEQIYKSQYRFRSNHSCELAVNELLSEIIKNNENRKPQQLCILTYPKPSIP